MWRGDVGEGLVKQMVIRLRIHSVWGSYEVNFLKGFSRGQTLISMVWRHKLTFTKRPFSASEKRAKMFWITSPNPAESTPAIEGENHVSQTRHLSVLR